jgi:alanyl aminopeptidase
MVRVRPFSCVSCVRTIAAAALAVLVGACPGPAALPVLRPPPPDFETKTPLPPPRDDGRLPALATPLAYALALDLDPSTPTFTGTVRIDIEVPATTSYVVLHARSLTITAAHAVVEGLPAQSRPARPSTRLAFGAKPPHAEELVLAFDTALPPGRASLFLSFSAPFDDELSGVYRVSDGGRWYGFTQFEATDARRAFPCFDEPGFKVPFDVSLTVPTGMIAVANTPELAHDEAGPKTTYRFAKTLPLPTYLVAFAFGELEIRELPRTTKPPIRLITTKGKSPLGVLGLEATSGLVDALGAWFGIPYPYEKLDIVAVPEFSAGAMENAGLITFREELLLLDPARASVRSRRVQAEVVAHELAHQWFGNLVTAAWWDDLWLNEGFATWMESRIVEQWRPSYGARNDAVRSQLGVMDLDALASARAVRQPVVTTSEANEAFDGITYEKGGAVLATIERWIGEETFQRGVREYLTSNAFQSVHADRLFSSLDRASGKDVTQMASTYLDRPGVPEITAHLECDRGSRWHMELGQEPWRPLGTKAPEDPERTWFVPVCVLAQGEKKPICAELAQGAPSLVAGRKCPAWVHPNADASYYRFTMPEPELLKLAAARTQLDVPARLTTLASAWAGVRSGKLKPAVILKVLAAFDDDPSRQVVASITAILATLDSTLVEDDARAAFRKVVVARLGKRKKDLGWLPKKDEASGSGDDAILRRSVLWTMGEIAADDATLREAEEHAARWLADQTSVDSDTASVAVDLATRRAGAPHFDKLLAIVRDGKTREDRLVALKALAGFDDPALLRRSLDTLLTDDVKTADVHYLLDAGYTRRTARIITEAWVRAHWEELRKKLPGSLGAGLVTAVGMGCTKAELEERTAFYAPRAAQIDGAARSLAVAIEASSLCTELRAHGAASFTRELLNGDGKSDPKKAAPR